jgi:NAD(P)-dependent dehydrogenase (short-subunit alcohol dehydrogenase family)
MSERIALVTGTSSGIGAAVAKELLKRGWVVVGIARREAKIKDKGYKHLALDLADIGKAAPAIEREVGKRLNENWSRVGLVNNAAVGLAGRIQDVEPRELARSFELNSAMPLWLMGFMIKHAKAPIRVVNVSSGAAVRPFPGLAAYCAAKAGLHLGGASVAAEDAPDLHILSYQPGVVDTEMQLATRSKSLDEFPWGTTFRQFHSEGRLVAPERPAAEIVEFLEAEGGERFNERRFQP